MLSLHQFIRQEVTMKCLSRYLILAAIALPMMGCQDWIEEQRQANFNQCKQACSSVFESKPSHYTLCMNSGMQSDGYYNGPACQSYVAPHLYCLGAGYHFPAPGTQDNAYADCVSTFTQKQLDQRFTREQNNLNRNTTVEQTCYQDGNQTKCVTRQD